MEEEIACLVNYPESNITTWALKTYKSLCLECQREVKKQVTTRQIDLIDMQSRPVKTCKWIMVHQDHLTKFCVLHAVISKRAAEGAPYFRLTMEEFTVHVITELKDVWPSLKFVHELAGIKRIPCEALFGRPAKIGLISSTVPDDIIERLETDELLKLINNPTSANDVNNPTSSADVNNTSTVHDINNPASANDLTSTTPPRQITNTDTSTNDVNDKTNPISSMTNIARHKNEAYHAQYNQADRMIRRRKVLLKSAMEGDTVALTISTVDRGRGDPRNI
ncbi:KRAB-A domain-containing protein 2-like [Penaeus vannamei]|uniref:KRAB-A domain-containing protein 2-like n=1 Tax=Penaeus vannamei TaxID=6689 RepID=UPI00387F5687